MTDAAIITPIIVAIVGGVAMWITARTRKPGEEAQQLMDGLRADRESDRRELDRQADELKDLRLEMDGLRAALNRYITRDALWSVHVIRQDGVISSLGGDPLELPRELQPWANNKEG